MTVLIDVQFIVNRNNNVAHNNDKNATISISFPHNDNTDAIIITDVGSNKNASYIITHHNDTADSIIICNKITSYYTSMII